MRLRNIRYVINNIDMNDFCNFRYFWFYDEDYLLYGDRQEDADDIKPYVENIYQNGLSRIIPITLIEKHATQEIKDNCSSIKEVKLHQNVINNVADYSKQRINLAQFLMMEIKEGIVIFVLNCIEEYRKAQLASYGGFFDNGIWFFNINNRNKSDEFDRLGKIINSCRNRYTLTIALEHRDFCIRKLFNSYITKIPTQEKQSDNKDSYGHADYINPFQFHSEIIIKRKLAESLNHTKVDESYDYLYMNLLNKCDYTLGKKWSVLLVDDNATEYDGKNHTGLTKTNGANDSTHIGKINIIADDLSWCKYNYKDGFNNIIIQHRQAKKNKDTLYIKEDYAESNPITIDTVTDVNSALMLLNNHRYDIVLLDFKLGYTDKQIEFGTKILEIINNEPDKYHAGTNAELDIMFISAYPTAVQEDMMAKGLFSNTDSWFIRRGACPTNTPWLFLYELHRLMKRRVEQLQKHVYMVKKDHKIKNSDNLDSPTALFFINWLFADPTLVRDRCKNSFNAFLTLRSTYDKIKYDVCDGKEHKDDDGRKDHKFVDEEKKESRLIRSMFPDVVCYSNTFWEHMQHLVYLTAYGTNRQWSEMWEELMCVEKRLNEAEKTIKYTDKTTSGLPQDTVKQIRTYIIGLKNGKY